MVVWLRLVWGRGNENSIIFVFHSKNMIQPEEHCLLCNHLLRDGKQGALCSLTGKKASFHTLCSRISFGPELEKRLISFNRDYYYLKTLRKYVFLRFLLYLFFSGLSALAVAFIYPFTYKTPEAFIPLIIFSALSLFLLSLAFAAVTKQRQKMGVALMKKEKFDNVLKRYKKEYEIRFKFGKELHGEQVFDYELKWI